MIPNYDAAVAYLLGRINYERNPALADRHAFRLDRMRRLLSLLGNPQEQIPAVHIAGTKGKGSTAVMTAAALAAVGLRTGLYTSPHLERFEERMQVNGATPTADEFVAVANRVAECVFELEASDADFAITYFEAATAMAWEFFARRGVEIAVLEVGLGGRLDATNVCRPIVVAVTNVSRDHTALLGETPAAIAFEKAGIVKEAVPCVSGVTDPEAATVIRAVCREQGAPLIEVPDRYRIDEPVSGRDRMVTAYAEGQAWGPLPIPLPGRHQAENAAVVLHVIDELTRQGHRISVKDVAAGWNGLKWPARIEVVSHRPTIVLDAAHNWASVGALVRTLAEDFRCDRRILLFAGSREKDVPGMLRRLAPVFDSVVLTTFRTNPRSLCPEDLQRIWRGVSDSPAHLFARSEEAFQFCRRIADPKSLICATGSFFLAAEIRRLIVS